MDLMPTSLPFAVDDIPAGNTRVAILRHVGDALGAIVRHRSLPMPSKNDVERRREKESKEIGVREQEP